MVFRILSKRSTTFSDDLRIARLVARIVYILFRHYSISSTAFPAVVPVLDRAPATTSSQQDYSDTANAVGVAASVLFSAVGIPVMHDGVRLSIPGLTLEVATECSSIRSSFILVVTAMVLAHLLLRAFWRKALVVMLALPLAVAKNGLRLFSIAILGTRVNPEFLTGRLIIREGSFS